MKLIVGLGNPEKKYEGTRHNAGFDVLVDIQRDLVLDDTFTNWQKNPRLKALVSESRIGEEKVILMMPQTYMNLSGEAVNIAAVFYKLSPEDIWVINDDVDLPLGKVRISFDGSSAGHKGVESIINHLGSKKFFRFRVGIRVPETEKIEMEKFVLQKFSAEEKKQLLESIHTIRDAIAYALKESLESAMNKFN